MKKSELRRLVAEYKENNLKFLKSNDIKLKEKLVKLNIDTIMKLVEI